MSQDIPANGSPRIYRITVVDVETQRDLFHLQWLLDDATVQFAIQDMCYQLNVPFSLAVRTDEASDADFLIPKPRFRGGR